MSLSKKIINIFENNVDKEKIYITLCEADKNISINEFITIIEYIKEKQSIILNFNDAVDICGTGGSGLARINTSTIASVILAKLGNKISKHGNKSASGKFGSFDLLESLGFIQNKGVEESDIIKKNLEHDMKINNLAFLYAPLFFPSLGKFSEARKQYKKPSFFNFMGPLLNPGNTKIQIIGCPFKDKINLMSEIIFRQKRLEKAFLIRGDDGLDEITLTGKSHITEITGKNISHYSITPEDFGLKICNFKEIGSQSNEQNISIANEILNGTCKTKHIELIAINIGFILYCLGVTKNYKEGVELILDKEYLK